MFLAKGVMARQVLFSMGLEGTLAVVT